MISFRAIIHIPTITSTDIKGRLKVWQRASQFAYISFTQYWNARPMKFIFVNELLLAVVNNAVILRSKSQKVKVTGTKMQKSFRFGAYLHDR